MSSFCCSCSINFVCCLLTAFEDGVVLLFPFIHHSMTPGTTIISCAHGSNKAAHFIHWFRNIDVYSYKVVLFFVSCKGFADNIFASINDFSYKSFLYADQIYTTLSKHGNQFYICIPWVQMLCSLEHYYCICCGYQRLDSMFTWWFYIFMERFKYDTLVLI